MATTKASTTIPSIARFLLTTLEPLFALGGVILCLTNPSQYLSGITREAITAIQPNTHFIYTQLGGSWLVIIWLEAVVLRSVDDLRIWKLIVISILLSDLLYCHSLAQAVGGWKSWADLSLWTGQDWAAAIGTWPFVVTRLAILGGVWEGKGKRA